MSKQPANAANRPRDRHQPKASYTPWIIAGVITVIGLAAIVAFMGGSSNGTSTGVEVAPVTVTGTALPQKEFSGLLDPATDPAVGMTIPTLSGQNPNGSLVSFPPTGKPTVYVVVAHWCPHCQAEVPRIATWMSEGQFSKAGVVFRTVSTAVDQARGNYPPSAWLAKAKWEPPVLVDSEKGDAATALGLTSFPYLLFVDGKGVVKQRATGELELADMQTGIKAITG